MAMNVSCAFPVTDTNEVAGPRRAAVWLAEQLGFAEERTGRAALVVSELATNLVKHARSGEILMRALCDGAGERYGLEIAAVDKGPGMSDSALSRVDGHSTSGTLGHGLGAIERLSDTLDLYTHTSGTAIVSTLRREESGTRGAVSAGRYDVGGVEVSKPGEEVCGDAWGWRTREGRLSLMVADGLGHGLHARDAAGAALDVFGRKHEDDPVNVVADVHAALRATRGAAVAMVAVNVERGITQYAGLGNISATILLPAGGRHSMVSHNGTAGHTAARIQQFQYPIPPGSVIVIASDGLSTHWDLSAYPGLRSRAASTIAAILYRDFSRRRDDVTVVVAKNRPSLAEKR
jgi:anti-sigma regulatory factor (Ser/Thr protein kinase)